MRSVHHKTQLCAGLLLLIYALGVVGFMWAEGLSAVDAAYFAVVTIATVGYGDISPKTEAGKLVAVLFILSGVATFMVMLASATEDFLNSRDRRQREAKSHMLAGLFFSEIGNPVIRQLPAFAPAGNPFRDKLHVSAEWEADDFRKAADRLRSWEVAFDARRGDLEGLRSLLNRGTTLLLRLLEHPALLETEEFSELLRALFHLREELTHRTDLNALPETDYAHLSGDIQRVFTLIVPQWIAYMRHLKQHYPYLFSLAVRTNPFDERAKVEVI